MPVDADVHALELWFLEAFAAEELVRDLRPIAGSPLVDALPAPEVGKARIAHAAARACQAHGLTATISFWKSLVGLRSRREAELVALAARFRCTLPPASAQEPLCPLPSGLSALHRWGGGRFSAVEEVGRGGAATVYKTWDGELGTWRALKVLHPELLAGVDDTHRRRFRREASLMARLTHPNIVQVVDIGQEEQGGVLRPWQVCEWVEGGDLARRITKGPLELDEALRILLPVLDALDLAHRNNVVHRDVKPANILLSPAGPKLCDFGLAALDNDGNSRSRHSMVGTPEFMAPEQGQARAKVDARADIYGWTATLVCALTGRETPGYLWNEEDRREVLEALPATVRDRVQGVIEGGTTRKPEHRLKDAAAMRAALDREPAWQAKLAELLRTPPWWAAPEDLAPVLGVPVDALDGKVPTGEPLLRLQPASLQGLAEGAGRRRVLELPGGVPLALRWIPGGEFWMGSQEGRPITDDSTRHRVLLSRGYWMSEGPINQAQWMAFRTRNPSNFKHKDLPVESLTWRQAIDWCQKLGRSLAAATGARLPTEAEWERACRAGTETLWFHGDEESGLERFARYGQRGHGATARVGQRLPNPWGLHDMAGNVHEWVLDWWSFHNGMDEIDPCHVHGDGPVVRGGGCDATARGCRPTFRTSRSPTEREKLLGFRLVIPDPGP